MDLAFSGTRARAEHDAECPEIGPICDVRAEPPQHHITTLWVAEMRLLAEYGLVSNLAVQAMLPLRMIVTRTRYTDLDGNSITLDYENIHHRNETLVGPGDAQLLLHGAQRFGTISAGARLGVSFPTGKVSEDPYELGDAGKEHQHIQFGTGTFDPVVGVDLGTSIARTSFGLFTSAQVPLYEGNHGYRAGARWTSGASISQMLGDGGPSVRATGIFYREWAEHWHGEVPTEEGNQGRTDVYVGPGVTVPFLDDWSASADVRFRAYGHAENAQLELPLIIEVSIGRLFHLESGAHDDHAEMGGDVADVVTAGEAKELLPVRGKWTVFDFWATWCEACNTVDRELRELAQDNSELAIRRVNIVDFDSPIAKKELPNVNELPRVRVVDPQGRVALEKGGTADEVVEAVRKAISRTPAGTSAR